MQHSIIKIIFLTSALFIPFGIFAQEEECSQNPSELPASVNDLIGSLRAVSNAQFKKVMDLKVNMDGNGSLAVHYENGKPTYLKLSYKNKGGEMNQVLSFADIAKGKDIAYEHPDMKGKAIIVKARKPFESDGQFKFEVRLRSKIDPDQYNAHSIDLAAHPEKQAVLKDGKIFKRMIISPGVKMLSWDGTFKSVEFN